MQNSFRARQIYILTSRDKLDIHSGCERAMPVHSFGKGAEVSAFLPKLLGKYNINHSLEADKKEIQSDLALLLPFLGDKNNFKVENRIISIKKEIVNEQVKAALNKKSTEKDKEADMKNTIKKTLTFLLALTMLFSLAACGKKPAENPENQPAAPDSTGTPGDTNHPEFVYTPEFITVKDSAKYGFRPLSFTDDGVFCMGHEPLPDGTVANYCGLDNSPVVLAFVDYNGNMKILTDYAPMENTEGADLPDYSSSSTLSKICPLSDGTFVFLEEHYISYYTGPEGVDRESDPDTYYNNLFNGSKYYYRHIDSTGKDLGSCEINANGEYIPTYQVVADENGNIFYNGERKIGMISSDGSTKTVVETDSYFADLMEMPDGSILVNVMDEGCGNGIYKKLDLAAGTLGEELNLPTNAFYNPIPGNDEYDFYFNNGSAFYGFKLGSEAPERLFAWLDCDLSSNVGGMDISVRDNGDIVIFTTQYCTEKPVDNEIVVISKKSWDQVPHKQTLTLGTLGINFELESAVLKFNRSNDKYRIEVINYTDDEDYSNLCNASTVDFYEHGRTKFLTAIVAGDVPDIISLSSMPFKQLAAKGILEDMNPWLEKDGEFSREDIVPSALSAMEVNGKLYRIFPGFTIQTAIGATSVVGDKQGWGYGQFNQTLAEMPEGCMPMEWYMVRDMAMELGLTLDMDSYVNWETGECNFARPEFTEFLEYLKLFPTSEEMELHGYTPEDEKAFSRGMQLLSNSSINSVTNFKTEDFYRNVDAQQISYIGFPSISGNGTVFHMDSGVAMTTKCRDKDGAWEFIREFLSEDSQKEIFGLPTNANLLNAQIDEAMQPNYKKDENGEYILDENGEKIKETSDFYYTPDCTEVPVYEMTAEQAELFRSLIEKGGVVADDNSAILKIVREEVQPYFAGQKTAEDVAKLIQSKVSIYVNEQK